MQPGFLQPSGRRGDTPPVLARRNPGSGAEPPSVDNASTFPVPTKAKGGRRPLRKKSFPTSSNERRDKHQSFPSNAIQSLLARADIHRTVKPLKQLNTSDTLLGTVQHSRTAGGKPRSLATGRPLNCQLKSRSARPTPGRTRRSPGREPRAFKLQALRLTPPHI